MTRFRQFIIFAYWYITRHGRVQILSKTNNSLHINAFPFCLLHAMPIFVTSVTYIIAHEILQYTIISKLNAGILFAAASLSQKGTEIYPTDFVAPWRKCAAGGVRSYTYGNYY